MDQAIFEQAKLDAVLRQLEIIEHVLGDVDSRTEDILSHAKRLTNPNDILASVNAVVFKELFIQGVEKLMPAINLCVELMDAMSKTSAD